MSARVPAQGAEGEGKTGGKILEVRGLPGNSVDRDRSIGIHEVFDATGGDWEIVQVVGNWDDGTAQKVTADALAVHGQFDARHHPGRLDRHRAGAASTPATRSCRWPARPRTASAS